MAYSTIPLDDIFHFSTRRHFPLSDKFHYSTIPLEDIFHYQIKFHYSTSRQIPQVEKTTLLHYYCIISYICSFCFLVYYKHLFPCTKNDSRLYNRDRLSCFCKKKRVIILCFGRPPGPSTL